PCARCPRAAARWDSARSARAWASCPRSRYDERDGVRRNGLASSDSVDALVRLGLHAHLLDLDSEDRGEVAANGRQVGHELRALEDDRDVDVGDAPAAPGDDGDRPREQVETRDVLPARIRVREVLADVVGTGCTAHRV